MAYLTKEERAAKRKADRKRGEKTEKKIGSWLRDVPSKLKSISDKQKAKNKADKEKRKAKREKEAKAHSAKMADRKKAKKARVAAADAKAKAAKAARDAKAKTAKTAKGKKKTYADRVADIESKSRKRREIDYSDPKVKDRLAKYKRSDDPKKGEHVGIQSLFGGKGTKQKVASTTKPKGEGFGVAFKRARKAYMEGGKKKTFDWRGKEYHTRWKDETPKQQLATRKGKTKGVEDYQKQIAKKWGGGKI